MARFEIGQYYECGDRNYDPIRVVDRTAKMATVANSLGVSWRMRIRLDAAGDEYMVDNSVPKKWRDIFTYRAEWVAE